MITASDRYAGKEGQRHGGSQPDIAARQGHAAGEQNAVVAVKLEPGLEGGAIVAGARVLEAGSSVVDGEDEREDGAQQDDRVAMGGEEKEERRGGFRCVG